MKISWQRVVLSAVRALLAQILPKLGKKPAGEQSPAVQPSIDRKNS